MKIKLTSVLVDDQAKAASFYTDILGFVKKRDVPVGAFRWLTVVSPEAPEGVELLLEPNENEAARAYQQALREQGIPATSFFAADVQKEYDRLSALGVTFAVTPMRTEFGTFAVFDDTCGNLIRIDEDRTD